MCFSERFKDLDIGSPQYMSPEGLLLNVYSEKTDIWALGIMLYEIFHGRTPFQYCRDEKELKNMIVRPLPENMFRKDLLPCFRQLINRMLEVDERLRPSIFDIGKEPAFAAV
jgi:serine/threonine protein kinase